MEPTDHNLRAFDEMHRRRRALRPGLPPIVKATLGDLTSKRVLHLQCGSGDASSATVVSFETSPRTSTGSAPPARIRSAAAVAAVSLRM